MPGIERYVGVYDADGTLRGEVSYLWGKVRGTAHCGLCDVTHSPLRRKRSWDAFVAGLPVPFETVHRDERDDAVRAASGEGLPVVLGLLVDTGGSQWVVLLGADELDALHGDVAAFASALAAATAAATAGPAATQTKPVGMALGAESGTASRSMSERRSG